jgi:hypothetical protein
VLDVALAKETGWTRDVSASGVFFYLRNRSQALPAPGSHIALELKFESLNARPPFRVACEGTVVRVERTPEHVGLAVMFSSHRFDGSSPASSARPRKRSRSAARLRKKRA